MEWGPCKHPDSLKWKGDQNDCPGRHWRHWSQASMPPSDDQGSHHDVLSGSLLSRAKSKSENRCENDLRSGANTPFHSPWCLWWPWPLSSKYFSWKYLLAKKPCAGAARVMIKIKTTAPPRSNMSASSLSPEVDKGSRRRLLPLTDYRCALQHNRRNGASWMSVQFYTLRQ